MMIKLRHLSVCANEYSSFMLLFSEDCQVNLSQPMSSLYFGILATVSTVSICNSQATIQDCPSTSAFIKAASTKSD